MAQTCPHVKWTCSGRIPRAYHYLKTLKSWVIQGVMEISGNKEKSRQGVSHVKSADGLAVSPLDESDISGQSGL